MYMLNFCKLVTYVKKMKRNRVIDAEFFYGATPEIFLRAAELRRNMTKAEKFLWRELKSKKIMGLTFRRQHPVNMFIADFYCHKARLVLEIDGSIHEVDGNKEKDKGREDEFEKFGITTIRFTNNEIYQELDKVLQEIEAICRKKVIV
jgi:very-short-patch-repair endonuclease